MEMPSFFAFLGMLPGALKGLRDLTAYNAGNPARALLQVFPVVFANIKGNILPLLAVFF